MRRSGNRKLRGNRKTDQRSEKLGDVEKRRTAIANQSLNPELESNPRAGRKTPKLKKDQKTDQDSDKLEKLEKQRTPIPNRGLNPELQSNP